MVKSINKQVSTDLFRPYYFAVALVEHCFHCNKCLFLPYLSRFKVIKINKKLVYNE